MCTVHVFTILRVYKLCKYSRDTIAEVRERVHILKGKVNSSILKIPYQPGFTQNKISSCLIVSSMNDHLAILKICNRF